MKRNLLVLVVTSLAFGMSSCADSSGRPRVNLVSTSEVIKSGPGIIGPVYTMNGVALQQYSPSLYTPFVYDHHSLADNAYYRERAIRAGQRGSVHVGPMTVERASE